MLLNNELLICFMLDNLVHRVYFTHPQWRPLNMQGRVQNGGARHLQAVADPGASFGEPLLEYGEGYARKGAWCTPYL